MTIERNITWINTTPGVLLSDDGVGTFEIRFYTKQPETPFALKCPSNGRVRGTRTLWEAKVEAELWYIELLELGMLPGDRPATSPSPTSAPQGPSTD